jgi:hypothetical protein
MTKKIKVGRNHYAIVDEDIYEYLNKFKWHYKEGYATATVRMHRLIIPVNNGEIIDHINHDRLDNRKTNLRACKRINNGWNRSINKNNKSGYKGVYWDKKAKKWKAQIAFCKKKLNLGRYFDKISAATAYNISAKKLFGKFANINVLGEGGGICEKI